MPFFSPLWFHNVSLPRNPLMIAATFASIIHLYKYGYIMCKQHTFYHTRSETRSLVSPPPRNSLNDYNNCNTIFIHNMRSWQFYFFFTLLPLPFDQMPLKSIKTLTLHTHYVLTHNMKCAYAWPKSIFNVHYAKAIKFNSCRWLIWPPVFGVCGTNFTAIFKWPYAFILDLVMRASDANGMQFHWTLSFFSDVNGALWAQLIYF